eukprot:Nk52_evm97s1073 gene=Nk52_evmTU97s1073
MDYSERKPISLLRRGRRDSDKEQPEDDYLETLFVVVPFVIVILASIGILILFLAWRKRKRQIQDQRNLEEEIQQRNDEAEEAANRNSDGYMAELIDRYSTRISEEAPPPYGLHGLDDGDLRGSQFLTRYQAPPNMYEESGTFVIRYRGEIVMSTRGGQNCLCSERASLSHEQLHSIFSDCDSESENRSSTGTQTYEASHEVGDESETLEPLQRTEYVQESPWGEYTEGALVFRPSWLTGRSGYTPDSAQEERSGADLEHENALAHMGEVQYEELCVESDILSLETLPSYYSAESYDIPNTSCAENGEN